MSSRVIQAAADLLRQGKQGAIVTITETIGSTPRKAGAKMLVDEDGRITGTIGGGCVEADMFALAREVMRTRQVQVREIDLSARSMEENDMLCGGRLKVLIEPIAAEDKLIIFGGGHISRALADVCAKLDFSITVTDDRPQFANPERIPSAQNFVVAPFEEQFEKVKVDASTYIVIVTRGHSYDEFCMEQAMKTKARFIGMVGSRTKVAVFRKNLRDRGVSQVQIDRVLSPVGLDIGAETPEEIAISIAAQLVQIRRATTHRKSVSKGCPSVEEDAEKVKGAAARMP